MNSIKNTIDLYGNVTKDIRVNEHDGDPVMNFTLVTNRSAGKDKDDIAEFHDCTLWGPLVTAVKDAMLNSPNVRVIGELRYRPVKENDGTSKITNKHPYIYVREILITARPVSN